ncbi:MAG: response regulator transcription factor [Tannerella sp.]|jgi:DNA-binding NarL/FixJ family response regulator|nr:response regulator transcription factor [Tannerella sp.]
MNTALHKSSDSKVKVHILENDNLFLGMFRKTINDLGEIELTTTYNTIAECREGLAAEMPDVLLLDINLSARDGESDGLTFCSEIRDLYHDLKIIMLSGYGEYTYIKRSLDNGANGYICKTNSSVEEIVVGIKTVVGGDKLIPLDFIMLESKEFRFTNREMQVLSYLYEGLTQEEIGRLLNRAKYTIKRHVENMKEKAGVKKTSRLLSEAVRLGMLPLSRP